MPSTPRTLGTTIAGALSLMVLVSVMSSSAVAPSSDQPPLPESIVMGSSLAETSRRHTIEHRFRVAPGAQAIDIDFTVEHFAADAPTQIDLGIRAPEGFRGWSEDHHGPIYLQANSASYGYLPGPIHEGEWTVLVGVANVPSG